MQRVNYQILLYPQHENRKIERVKKNISGDARNLERRKDSTKKIRNMSRRPN